PRNLGDRATPLSADLLVRPLVEYLTRDQPAWKVDSLIAEQACKKDFLELLRSAPFPAVLFTASHGRGFKSNDELQAAHQGALIMQDWVPRNPFDVAEHFTADDVEGLNSAGMIAFHFACYGAGTPEKSNFFGYHGRIKEPDQAPKPFLSALPKRWLANGAL